MSEPTPLKAVDFFCGAGGMSYGLQQAGIQVLAGIDNAANCRQTYCKNINNALFIEQDINALSEESLSEILKIERGDPNIIFAGCTPCQFWSKIQTDRTKSAETAHLLEQFQRFIEFFLPGFIIVENVPGLYKRKGESILQVFLDFLSNANYAWADGVINTVHYGVPQTRKRYLLLATRLYPEISLPSPEHSDNLTVYDFIGSHNGFEKIAAGHKDSSDWLHTAASLSSENMKRISVTPPSGGCRTAWASDKELQIPAYEGKDNIFKDVYGRMFWDRPAPTITTRFNSLSNGRFGHPEENRALSIREGATLQTFPRDFYFYDTNIAGIARQIGNAVPPELARRIGVHIKAVNGNG